MMNDTKNIYEGMFLLDSGTPDFQAATEPVTNVLSRNEAEVLSIKPWDDRKLAYEIKGRRRGMYALCYFQVDPQAMPEIEHDLELDERVLRSLILRQEEVSDEILNAQTPAEQARQAAEAEAKAKEEAAQA